MILPMWWCLAPRVSGVSSVRVSVVVVGPARGVARGGDGHERRPDDPVAQPVAAPDLLDDLALGAAGAGHVGDGLVLARVERRAGRRRRSASRPRSRAALRSLRSMARDALEPRVVGDARRAAARWPGRSRRRASRTLRMRSSPARPRSRWRSSAVRRLKFRNSARSRWRAARYSSACAVAASRSRPAAPRCRRAAWSARRRSRRRAPRRGSCGRVRLGIQVVHQLVHEAGHEADRADRLGVAHAGRPEHADDADGAAGPAVRGEDERHVVHLLARVLGADEDVDAARRPRRCRRARRGRPGSRAPLNTCRSLSLWANSGAAMTLSRPSLNTSSIAAASNSRRMRTIRSPTRARDAVEGRLGAELGERRLGVARPSRSARRSLSRPATRLSVGLVDASASSRVTAACLMAPSRRTRIRLAIRSLTATRSTRRMWAALGLAGVARPAERVRPARVVAARRNQCSLANSTCPNWWRIISCSTAGQRHRVDDRLDVEAVAGVGRDAARRWCAGGSAARPSRGRRGCCAPSRWTRRGR